MKLDASTLGIVWARLIALVDEASAIDGQLDARTRNCTITYRRGGKKLAVAVVHRDLEGLRAEVELETASAAIQ